MINRVTLSYIFQFWVIEQNMHESMHEYSRISSLLICHSDPYFSTWQRFGIKLEPAEVSNAALVGDQSWKSMTARHYFQKSSGKFDVDFSSSTLQCLHTVVSRKRANVSETFLCLLARFCVFPCCAGFNYGSVAPNTPPRMNCFLGSDVGSCGTRHFTFGLDVTRPLSDGLNSYYRGQGPVSFKIVEAPAASNVGPVSTGGGDELSSGMGFVIVREKSQPTVMFPVPVCIYQLPKRFLGYVSHTNGFVLIAFCRVLPA